MPKLRNVKSMDKSQEAFALKTFCMWQIMIPRSLASSGRSIPVTICTSFLPNRKSKYTPQATSNGIDRWISDYQAISIGETRPTFKRNRGVVISIGCCSGHDIPIFLYSVCRNGTRSTKDYWIELGRRTSNALLKTTSLISSIARDQLSRLGAIPGALTRQSEYLKENREARWTSCMG